MLADGAGAELQPCQQWEGYSSSLLWQKGFLGGRMRSGMMIDGGVTGKDRQEPSSQQCNEISIQHPTSHPSEVLNKFSVSNPCLSITS